MNPDNVRRELVAAARRRVRAEETRAEAMDTISRLLAPALAAGLTITEIAGLAGLTRQTIYDRL